MRSQLALKLRSLCTREGEGTGGNLVSGLLITTAIMKSTTTMTRTKAQVTFQKCQASPPSPSLLLPSVGCPSFAACLCNCCKMCFVNLFKFMLKRSTKPDNSNNNNSEGNYITITSWQQQNRKLSNNNNYVHQLQELWQNANSLNI